MSDLDAIREAHDGPHECWNGGPNTEWCEDRCDTRVVLDALEREGKLAFQRKHEARAAMSNADDARADADRLAEALRYEASVNGITNHGLEALRQHEAAKEAERDDKEEPGDLR